MINVWLLVILFSILLIGIGFACLGAALLVFAGQEAAKAGREEAREMIAEAHRKYQTRHSN